MIDIGSVAFRGAVLAGVAFGQIVFVVFFVQVILAHQSGVGATQTCRWKRAPFKCKVVVVASCPSEFGQDTRTSNVTDAGSSNGACDAGPFVFVIRRVVEVLRVAAIGGGGPRRFGAGGFVHVGYLAFDGACLTTLLATDVLVLFGWAEGTFATANISTKCTNQTHFAYRRFNNIVKVTGWTQLTGGEIHFVPR